MHVLVIGASKGTGRALVDELVGRGHRVRALVRAPDQRDALRQAGAEPVVGDLEGDLTGVFDGVEAVAFCAGSGSSTGADATLRVDLHGAVRTIDACVAAGIRRVLLLSSMSADDPLAGRPELRHYYAAMHARERILATSGLDATVVRPGRLTHDQPTGKVELGAPTLDHRGTIPRGDVAALLAACLEDPTTVGLVFAALGGDTPMAEALAALPRA